MSRDLSVALLGQRLQRAAAEPLACKKGQLASVVDPKDEAVVPKPRDELGTSRPSSAKGGKGKGAAAAAAADGANGASSKTRPLCAAFAKDVLDGGAVPFGKEVPPAAALLGTDHAVGARVAAQPARRGRFCVRRAGRFP